jgi:uncharacterized membrane protein YdbT with pleckstrin-like domain
MNTSVTPATAPDIARPDADAGHGTCPYVLRSLIRILAIYLLPPLVALQWRIIVVIASICKHSRRVRHAGLLMAAYSDFIRQVGTEEDSDAGSLPFRLAAVS